MEDWLEQLLLSHQKITENFPERYAGSNKPILTIMVRYATLTHWTQLLIFEREGSKPKASSWSEKPSNYYF